MRIIVTFDYVLYTLVRYLKRNKYKSSIDNARFVVSLCLSRYDVDRYLRFYESKGIIRIGKRHVFLKHDVELIYTPFPHDVFLRTKNPSDICELSSIVRIG